MTPELTHHRREYYARITALCEEYARSGVIDRDKVTAMENAGEGYTAALQRWCKGVAA